MDALHLFSPGRLGELPVKRLAREIIPILLPVIGLVLDGIDLHEVVGVVFAADALDTHQVMRVQSGLTDDAPEHGSA